MSITEGMGAPSSIAESMLKQRIHELEAQMLHARSTLTNVMANIRQAASEEDYDEIISICNDWDPAAREEGIT